MSKQFWGVIVLVILIFVGIFAFTGNDKPSTKDSKSSSKAPTNNVQGEGKSGVVLVEYGDFQCPVCAQYYPIVKQVQEKYNTEIGVQYRHFPLTSIHQNAFAAARASEAAAKQGKFWEMYDVLFQTQQQWSKASDPIPYFNQYAKQISLDVVKFKTDFTSISVNDLINADMAAGNKLGITGTPTFYLDGKKMEVQPELASFTKQIDAAIANKSQTPN